MCGNNGNKNNSEKSMAQIERRHLCNMVEGKFPDFNNLVNLKNKKKLLLFQIINY